MTIDDLIPDKELNLGGRPPKEETEEEDLDNKVFTADSGGEEWWRSIMKQCLDSEEFPENSEYEAISKLADFVFIFPVEVRTELDKHDIFETDWKTYLANRPHLFGDPRLPDEWSEKTENIHYSMTDTMEISNGNEKPFYDQLENPNEYRDKKTTKRGKDVPSDGAFSDLIEDA